MIANQKVLIVNNNNGERFETYIIKGERGTGIIGLNGAAARKGQVGDELIIMTFVQMTPEEAKVHQPKTCFPTGTTKSFENQQKNSLPSVDDSAGSGRLHSHWI